MLIVGELINSSRKHIKAAVEANDVAYIQQIAKDQAAAGATYIDVNCGTQVFNEPETMKWLVEAVQEVVEQPLCIDSPNPKALEVGLELAKVAKPMVNSITAEEERFGIVLPLIQKHKAKVVALCMDDSGMPDNAEKRIAIADKLIKDLTSNDIAEDDIYIDPLVSPVSTSDRAGMDVIETTKYIKDNFPNVHVICGLSNISYGLPNRKVLNQVFMIQLMTAGMDAFILDPLDKQMMGFMHASAAVLAQDPFCGRYLTAHRNGLFDE